VHCETVSVELHKSGYFRVSSSGACARKLLLSVVLVYNASFVYATSSTQVKS